MNCLLCQRLVKDTTFLHLLMVNERFFCHACEIKLLDGNESALDSLITALNQGDVVLIQGIESLVKQYGVQHIQYHELMRELKEKIIHQEGAMLLKEVTKRQ